MNDRPYLTDEITETIQEISNAASCALTAGLEPDPERAYLRLMQLFHALSDCEMILFDAMHTDCLACGYKSAQEQPGDCPCCGTLNSSIPIHLRSRIDAVWQADGSVVTCPVCQGECDVLVDGVAAPCPCCGGAGATHKEDALIAIREMHYEAQGLLNPEAEEES